MYQYTTTITVRYGETDQMGIVYYGNYALYYEIGRTEAIKNLGYTYKQMEADGIIMPVLDLQIKYYKAAKYDDVLNITTTIAALPTRKMTFHTEILNTKEEIINSGFTTLIFLNKTTNRICSPPQKLIELLQPYFA